MSRGVCIVRKGPLVFRRNLNLIPASAMKVSEKLSAERTAFVKVKQ